LIASDLRQTVLAGVLSGCSIQCSLQKHLNMLSRSAALALLTERMKKKKITFCKAYKDWASGSERR
jgi:hypothetical protein